MKKFLKLLILLLFLIPINIKASTFEINSKNAVLLNLTNNEIIYEKNKDEVIKVASMQKVMTAIVAIENLDNLNDTLLITPGFFDSLDPDLAVVGLSSGDKVTYYDLLYGTLLRSGADAAYSLAVAVSGNEEDYVKLMNEKAKELGLKNTVFKNTTGLDAEGQQSTVYDISILMKYALNNKEFKKIINTPEYTINDEYLFSGPVKKAKSYGMNYFLGGKTGYTEEAGLCLVSYASNEDVDYLLVTARADEDLTDQNFKDQKTIYDYYMNNYSFNTVISKNDTITKIKTMYDEEVEIKATKDVELYLNNSVFQSDLDIVYKGKKVLDKNVKKGDKIGKYLIKYNDLVLYEEDVKSPINVQFRLKRIFLIVLLVIVFSTIIHLIKRKRRRKRRRRKTRY